MRKASLRALRRATGEFYGLENSKPLVSTAGGHEQKGAARKGTLPLVRVVALVALTLAVVLAGFAVQPAEAQTAGGRVIAWGENGYGESTVPSGLSGVKAVSAGQHHSLALKEDGTVVAWGYNSYGQSSVPSGLGGITAIDAGEYHSLALDAIAPGPVQSFDATADDGKVSLSWTKPSDTDFEAVRVLRSTSGNATTPDEAGQTQVYEGKEESFEDTGLTNGTTYYYTAFARDKVGNWSAGATQSAKPLDTTAPDTTITSGPSGVVNSSTAEFAFSSSESGSTFQCSLDSAAFGACSTPQKYADLSEGPHTFEVRATDAAGNTDTAAALSSWTVNTAAPTVDSVTPSPGQAGVARNVSLTATFSEQMDPNTLTGSTFTLQQKSWYQVRKKKGKKVRRVWTYTWVPVSAGVSCDSGCKTATLDPASDLLANTDYMAVVTTGAKDEAGSALAQNHSWTFKTGTS